MGEEIDLAEYEIVVVTALKNFTQRRKDTK